MYRGRPPPRGGYPPPFEGRSQGPPPLGPHYPAPGYRDNRSRPRPPYHPSYHDHVPPDACRRSPPCRRHPSPGSGSHRGGEYWAGGPPRERSPSPHGPIPLDRNLVITVGNELIGPSGSAPTHHHDRDYPPRPEYEWSRSRDRSPDRSQTKSRGCSPDQSRAKSRARSKSRPRSQSYSPDGSWTKSRSKSRGRGRSKSCSLKKKRKDSEDSPSLRSSDSPRVLEGFNISRVADQLLLAVKGMEPHMVASVLSELRSDPHMAQRASLDGDRKDILNLLGGAAVVGTRSQEKTDDDIDDEEKFLYGDSEEPKPPPASEPLRHHELDLYEDVMEEALYRDYPPQKAYGLPPGASSHLQDTPTMGEVDVRYVTRPTISPDQNITVQMSNPAFPPGTEPLEQSEREALEEYKKIQDLLKTIGLDLGVSEISKMASRTKERLHGNKPPPKTPTRCRRYSSSSSDSSHHSQGHRRRSHSGNSISRSSRSWSRGWGGRWSSDEDGGHSSALPKSHKDREVKETRGERSDAVPQMHKEPLPQKNPDLNTLPPHPGVPIPTYPPSQVHGMMPPNFPPPSYGQYGNYLPYMHQQWPPMYPPPNMSLPPQTGPDGFPPTLPYKQAYNKEAPEPVAKGVLKSSGVQDGEKGKVSSHDRKQSEQQNNESQKQKVLEEREKLKQEREIRMKKKEYLMKELERLRKQQGELLRKKRREKGGHKDPLLQEISHLQEEVMTQISNLRKEHEAAEKKRNEIDKVALILGLSPSDQPRRTSKPAEDQGVEALPPPPPEKKKREAKSSPEGRQAASSSMIKTLDPYDRPWASTPNKSTKNTPSEEKLTKPAKGSEFLVSVRGFFCLLCKEFYGDAICAEEHVTTHAHNEKYKKQMYENPLYEQRRNLDRQAGLASETSGKKRKHEDDEKGNKDKDEKSKHKKEKKDKEKKKDEDDADQKEEKSKVKKEEEEKLKLTKKEEDIKDAKSLEEERPSYSKKDEDEKYKYSKKDDKYRNSREEEERDKYSRRDEDDRYKYSREEEYRYRYRRDEDDRYDNRPKYGQREDEDKHKYRKYSDFKPKYDKERDEGKPKAEKEAFKKVEPGKPAGKPEVSKPEPPPKPYDLPKILCGPSPAMRAKLRKQSLEAGKPAPTVPSFGKFTWKKRENVLAKEAEEVAAEFIKDDKVAAKQKPDLVEDSFAKSMAFAKAIAQKLAGQQHTPPPWVSNGANRGRIRPNLPAPAAVMRITTMMGKPAPLNTFLSMRPQNTSLLGPPPREGPTFPNPLTKAQNALLETKPQPPVGRPGPFESMPAPARPEQFEAKSLPLVSRAPPLCVKLVPPVSVPAPSEATSVPSKTIPAPSAAKPAQPTMINLVSDVAAPGVPESEQTRTVFVKPPPFMSKGDGALKSEKLKSNLAAAKAQDLFDIFYSSIGQSGSSSISKPATEARVDGSSTNKSQCSTPQAQKPQPQPFTQSQPPPAICSSPLTESNKSSSPKTQPESDIQITSVWSLQSTPASTPDATPSERTPKTTQPKLNLPAQTEAQSVPRKQSLTPKSESQIAPQSDLEPTQTQSHPKLTPQIQTEPQSESQPDQDTQPSSYPETHPDAAPEQEPQPSPKTRGKATSTKRTPPAPRPVRQIRSQTRYQTRRQQQNQSEPEPELASGDSDSAASDPERLEMSDRPGSGSHPEEGASSEGDPQMTQITPETLGLPSNMKSLDFDRDFNFE